MLHSCFHRVLLHISATTLSTSTFPVNCGYGQRYSRPNRSGLYFLNPHLPGVDNLHLGHLGYMEMSYYLGFRERLVDHRLHYWELKKMAGSQTSSAILAPSTATTIFSALPASGAELFFLNQCSRRFRSSVWSTSADCLSASGCYTCSNVLALLLRIGGNSLDASIQQPTLAFFTRVKCNIWFFTRHPSPPPPRRWRKVSARLEDQMECSKNQGRSSGKAGLKHWQRPMSVEEDSCRSNQNCRKKSVEQGVKRLPSFLTPNLTMGVVHFNNITSLNGTISIHFPPKLLYVINSIIFGVLKVFYTISYPSVDQNNFLADSLDTLESEISPN